MKCRFFWGSHGCDIEAGHDQPHECTACSQFTEKNPGAPSPGDFEDVDGWIRYCEADDEQGESVWDDDRHPATECLEWSPVSYPSTGFWLEPAK